MLATHTDTPFQSYTEVTLDALINLEGYLVMLGTAEQTVQLATSAEVSMGVLARKEAGNPHVQVTALGGGTIVRAVAGGAIAKGAKVTWGTGGKVVVVPASTGTYKALGQKVSQGTSANNDVIEILIEKETVIVA